MNRAALERAAKVVQMAQSAMLMPDYGGPVQRWREEQLKRAWADYDAALVAYEAEQEGETK